jgi:tetratricopeptide (TPR) repeat protein
MDALKNDNDNESKGNKPFNSVLDKSNVYYKLGTYQEALDWYDNILTTDLKYVDYLNKNKETKPNLENCESPKSLDTKPKNMKQNIYKNCKMCGKSNSNSYKLCNKCRNSLSSKCSNCRKPNPFGASFCNSCGFILK